LSGALASDPIARSNLYRFPLSLAERTPAKPQRVDIRAITDKRAPGNIYESGRLTREATIRKFLIVQTGGDREGSPDPAGEHRGRKGETGIQIPAPPASEGR